MYSNKPMSKCPSTGCDDACHKSKNKLDHVFCVFLVSCYLFLKYYNFLAGVLVQTTHEPPDFFLLSSGHHPPPCSPGKSSTRSDRRWSPLSPDRGWSPGFYRSPSEPRSPTSRVGSPVSYRAKRARSQIPSYRATCEF